MPCCSKVRSTASAGATAGGSRGDQPRRYVCLPRRTIFADQAVCGIIWQPRPVMPKLFWLICQFSLRVRAHSGAGKAPPRRSCTGAAGTNRGTHGGKKIDNPGRIPATGTGAAFHQDLWQTSIYSFKSQSISLLFIFAEDLMYRCRCCLARAMASGDGRS